MSYNTRGHRMKALLLVFSLLLVGLAACTQAGSDVAPEPDVEEEGEAEAPAGEANVVEVTEEEFVINMPASLPAGPTSFEVTNMGTIEHNFEVEGQGIEEEFEQNLQPGESQTLQVDLAPGDYVVYCPVGDHRAQGMEVQLSVTE